MLNDIDFRLAALLLESRRCYQFTVYDTNLRKLGRLATLAYVKRLCNSPKEIRFDFEFRNTTDQVDPIPQAAKRSDFTPLFSTRGEMNDTGVAMNCPGESTVVWMAKGVTGNVLSAAGSTIFTVLIKLWIENRKAVNNAPILQKDFDTISARLKELENICCEERGLGRMLIKRDEEDLKARLNALLRRSESIHKWLAAFSKGESISHGADRCRYMVLSLTIQDIGFDDAGRAHGGANVDPGV
jgi:hypothetical protein